MEHLKVTLCPLFLYTAPPILTVYPTPYRVKIWLGVLDFQYYSCVDYLQRGINEYIVNAPSSATAKERPSLSGSSCALSCRCDCWIDKSCPCGKHVAAPRALAKVCSTRCRGRKIVAA